MRIPYCAGSGVGASIVYVNVQRAFHRALAKLWPTQEKEDQEDQEDEEECD